MIWVRSTPWKTNSSPLQNSGWKTIFLLGFGLFSGALAVSFREGILCIFLCLRDVSSVWNEKWMWALWLLSFILSRSVSRSFKTSTQWLFLLPVFRWDRWHSPSLGRKNATYIPPIVLAFWGVICYLPPLRELKQEKVSNATKHPLLNTLLVTQRLHKNKPNWWGLW